MEAGKLICRRVPIPGDANADAPEALGNGRRYAGPGRVPSMADPPCLQVCGVSWYFSF